MFSVKWRRPSTVEYPQVWHKFERTRDGKVLKFIVQDLTEDMHMDVIEFMNENYVKDEIWNVSTGVSSDPAATQLFAKYLFENAFPQKVQLVCLLDDESESKDGKKTIVGVNLLGICSNEEEENFEEFLISQPIVTLLSAYEVLKQNCPIVYEKYNVNLFMNSLGLGVNRKYRGMGIASEILATRVPLCKAIGISLTMSYFTSIISQKAAAKVGYVEDASYSYEDLSKNTGVEFKTETKSTKMMSKIIK